MIPARPLPVIFNVTLSSRNERWHGWLCVVAMSPDDVRAGLDVQDVARSFVLGPSDIGGVSVGAIRAATPAEIAADKDGCRATPAACAALGVATLDDDDVVPTKVQAMIDALTPRYVVDTHTVPLALPYGDGR